MSEQTKSTASDGTPAPPAPRKQSANIFLPGNATEYELMQKLMNELPPTEVVGRRWFSYDNATGCWVDNDKDHYRHLALRVIHPKRRRVTTAHRVLDHLEDMSRRKLDFSGFIKAEAADTILVNTLNKVLRVSPSGIEVLEHDQEFRFTRSLAVDYAPDVHHEEFEAVRVQIFADGADLALLQLLWANTFIPDARYAACAVLYGEAGAGKDTIMGPLMGLFGSVEHGLITHFSITQICDPRSYALPQLQFAALNVCTELDSKQVEDSSIFKSLVSGGSLPARSIYEKPFSMTTACKLFFLTNNMPEFKSGTDAERRRMRFLRCNFKPAVVDVLVKERLKLPHSGTLNWVLEGVQRLLRMGNQTMPFGGSASQEVHTRFFSNNDPLNGFVSTYCVLDAKAECCKDELKQVFDAYADDNDVSKHFRDAFFRSLYKRFTSLTPKRARVGNQRIQVVTGIRLNEAGMKLVTEATPAPPLVTPGQS